MAEPSQRGVEPEIRVSLFIKQVISAYHLYLDILLLFVIGAGLLHIFRCRYTP